MFWRLYYDDGSTYSSLDGTPFDAPRTGVQVLVFEDPEQRGRYHLVSQADYYYFEPERSIYGWWFADFPGMIDHMQRAKRPLILFGRMMKDDAFTDIECQALEDYKGKISWRRRNQSTNYADLDGEVILG